MTNTVNYANDRLFDNSCAKVEAELLLRGFYKDGTRLNLSNTKIDTKGYEYLAFAIRSGSCPNNLFLGLAHNKGSVEAIFDALASGSAPTGLTLDLSHHNQGKKILHWIVDAIGSGRLPENLTLKINNNSFSYQDIEKILMPKMEEHGCPPGFKIEIEEQLNKSCNNLTLFDEERLNQFVSQCRVRSFEKVANTAESHKFAFSNYKGFTDQCAKLIAQNLLDRTIPAGTEILLDNCNMGAQGKKYLAAAIRSGTCPDNLTFNLSNNAHGHDGDKAIMAALASPHCPSHLTLDLSNQKLGKNILLWIGKLIEKQKLPQDLTLIVNTNGFTHKDLDGLKAKIRQHGCPKGLSIRIEETILPSKGEMFDIHDQAELDNLIKEKLEQQQSSGLNDAGMFAQKGRKKQKANKPQKSEAPALS